MNFSWSACFDSVVTDVVADVGVAALAFVHFAAVAVVVVVDAAESASVDDSFLLLLVMGRQLRTTAPPLHTRGILTIIRHSSTPPSR